MHVCVVRYEDLYVRGRFVCAQVSPQLVVDTTRRRRPGRLARRDPSSPAASRTVQPCAVDQPLVVAQLSFVSVVRHRILITPTLLVNCIHAYTLRCPLTCMHPCAHIALLFHLHAHTAPCTLAHCMHCVWCNKVGLGVGSPPHGPRLPYGLLV